MTLTRVMYDENMVHHSDIPFRDYLPPGFSLLELDQDGEFAHPKQFALSDQLQFGVSLLSATPKYGETGLSRSLRAGWWDTRRQAPCFDEPQSSTLQNLDMMYVSPYHSPAPTVTLRIPLFQRPAKETVIFRPDINLA